jgi:pyruvate kinase
VEKDIELLSLTARHTVDYVALSFVRSKDDVDCLREQLNQLKVDCGIIAKIEHPDAVNNFEEILAVTDGIMVARGDLGVEYPIEIVPSIQKRLVKRCLEVGKPVIVATQMLDSMIKNPRPTRAEVSDIANTIYDRADAIMLSGESASGKYPTKAVKMMVSVAKNTEPTLEEVTVPSIIESGSQREAMVMAAYQLATSYQENGERVEAFVVMTQTGVTAQLLSRLRPNFPILALADSTRTLDRLKLVWGVEPVDYDYNKGEVTDTYEVLQNLKERGYLQPKQKVIIVYGERWGQTGQTSVVRIQEV